MSVASIVAELPRAPLPLAERVALIDLAVPLERLAAATGAAPAAIAQVERHYRAFLAIKARHPHEILPPSRSVDLLWHAHIIADVGGYLHDCQFVAGRLINHRHGGGGTGHAAAFERTRLLMREEAGIDLAALKSGGDPLIAGLAVPGECA